MISIQCSKYFQLVISRSQLFFDSWRVKVRKHWWRGAIQSWRSGLCLERISQEVYGSSFGSQMQWSADFCFNRILDHVSNGKVEIKVFFFWLQKIEPCWLGESSTKCGESDVFVLHKVGKKGARQDSQDILRTISHAIWVCLKMVSTPKPNGFADHYPY